MNLKGTTTETRRGRRQVQTHHTLSVGVTKDDDGGLTHHTVGVMTTEMGTFMTHANNDTGRPPHSGATKGGGTTSEVTDLSLTRRGTT